jgi:hypothetical protein
MKPNDEKTNPGFARAGVPIVSTPPPGVGAGGGGSPDQPIHRTVRTSPQPDPGMLPSNPPKPVTVIKK